MTATITNRKPSAVEFRVDIPWEEVLVHAESAARRLSKVKTIKGFRPGNAPYWAAARDLGAMTVLEEALVEAVPATLSRAVRDEKIEVIGEPSITIEKLAPENPVIYTARLLLLPDITVGELARISCGHESVVVTPKDIDGVVEELRTMQVIEARVERPAERADAMTVNLTMSIGGVPVEGGSATGHVVHLAEDHYIPGLTDQLIGVSAGQTKTFQLEFPKEHYQKNLAGRTVDFSTTVTEVRERKFPDVDDAFVSRLGQKSIADLRSLIEKNLQEEKTDKEQKRFETTLVKAVLEHTRFSEIPDFLITEEAQRIVHELEENIQHKGGAFNDYLQHIGKTREQLLLDFAPQSLERVRAALLLRHLAKEHGITVTDDEVNHDIEETKKLYEKQDDTRDALETPAMREQVRLMIRNKKVLEWLKARVGGSGAVTSPAT